MIDHEGVSKCSDCCCARSWKALGIEYTTGKSIPEHIEELRSEVSRLTKERDALVRVRELADDYMKDSECYCLDAEEMRGRDPCIYCQMSEALCALDACRGEGKGAKP